MLCHKLLKSFLTKFFIFCILGNSYAAFSSAGIDMDLAEHPGIEAELRKLQAYVPLISCLDVSDNSLDNSTLELLSSFTA